jgi:tripartite-type tricarboxylate transporter receptor subunit TctC
MWARRGGPASTRAVAGLGDIEFMILQDFLQQATTSAQRGWGMDRRRFLQAGALLGTLEAGSMRPTLAATPATYPDHTIQLIVPFAPGGPTDTMGRFVAKSISDKLGQPVVPINRPGAGGNIGTQYVARAAPDGYTLLLVAGSHTIRPAIYPNLQYDAIADFTPVSMLASGPLVLTVRNTLPVHSVQELIALARSQPGKLNFASGGTGTASHLAGELFKQMAGLEMTHVPYNGAALSSEALLGGVVDVLFNNATSALPMVHAGQVRALAVTGPKRWTALPDLPTVAESGLPGYSIQTWYALLAPAHLDPHTQDALNSLLAAALATPEGTRMLASQGLEGSSWKPAELRAFMVDEEAKWARIAKVSGAKVD